MLRSAFALVLSLIVSLAANAQRTQFEPPDLPAEFAAGLKNNKYKCELIDDAQLGVHVMNCPPASLGVMSKCGMGSRGGVTKCPNLEGADGKSNTEYCTMTVSCENPDKEQLIPMLKQVACKMSKYNGCPSAQECFDNNILENYFIPRFDPLDEPEPPRDQPNPRRGIK